MRTKGTSTTLGADAVRLTASKMITLIISMLTVMLLSRFRTFEEYGTYSQLLLVLNLFTTLLMLGLPNSINYFLARTDSQEEKQRFLSVYYTLSTLLSVIIGLTLVLAIPLIEKYFHNEKIGKYYYFLAFYPWASIVSASIENVLVVYKRTRFLMQYRVIHSLAMLLSVLIVQWLGLGFSDYMISFVAINAFFAVTVYIISSRLSGGIKALIDRELIKQLFAFSIPIGLATVVGTLNAEIDKLLIGYLMDTEQLAIYTNAAKELPIAFVASSITAVLLPQLTRMVKKEQGKEAVKLWGYATELSLIVICLIVAGVVTFAKEAMTILYSDKYLPGLSVFRVYNLVLLLRVTYFGIVLNAYGKTKKIFYCSLLSLGLNVVLNPLFFWLFGMIGPAVATFISMLVVLLLQLRMTAKTVGISFCEVFPWKKLLSILLINALFAVVFYVIKRILPLDIFAGEITEALVLGAIWCFVYMLFMKKHMVLAWHNLNEG